MAIIPPFYMNAVVSIGMRNVDGEINWIGTGFFVKRKITEETYRPFLVTNRHVVENQKSIVIRMKELETNKLICIDTPLLDADNLYVVYHSNTKIDIAVIPIPDDYIKNNNLEFNAFDIDEHAMASDELRENGVDEGFLIYMLGYPMSLVNLNSLDPICRLGCVARMNSAEINETGSILVDIQNFPGNSGSPVITRPEHSAIIGTPSLNSSVLLGVVCSYICYQEPLFSKNCDKVIEIKSENSGLAYVHPVEFIREIIDAIK